MANIEAASQASPRARRAPSIDPAVLGTVLAAFFALPLLALIALALSADGDYLAHIARTRLGELARTSALLALVSAGLAAALGVGCAWLVTRYDFAGRRLVSWLLVLPLAMPGYVAAYAWYAMTAPGSLIEPLIGFDLPAMRGLGGAALVFALTLYPYVYLLARNAMEAHGSQGWDMARSLGAGPWRAFARVALPLTWPAAAAGAALVAMEVLADYGVADFLGVSTLTVGIVRAWSSFGDPAAAAQLAVMLLFGALLALGAERVARGRRQFVGNDAAERAGRRVALAGWRSGAALGACLAPVLVGLLMPAAYLAWIALDIRPGRSIMPALEGTLWLAALSAVLAIILGTLAAYTLRSGGRTGRAAVRILQAGYAVPGAVAAIAILAALVYAQRLLGAGLGAAAPLITGGSLIALLLAYQVRFAAVAILPSETALLKVRADLDEAAHSLGASRAQVLRRVHLPLAASGIATAGLLVAIEVMKELPATMILRPFNLDTLAVTAHNYASDERLAQAALPALVLLALCAPATAALNLLRVRR